MLAALPLPARKDFGRVTTPTKPVSVVEEAWIGRGPPEISSMYTPGVL
jgi:hypothetical protein